MQEAKKTLRTVMKAKFGDEGTALVDSLGEGADQARLESLLTAAAVALTLDEVRGHFHLSNGNS
jgi:hypothetical protein